MRSDEDTKAQPEYSGKEKNIEIPRTIDRLHARFTDATILEEEALLVGIFVQKEPDISPWRLW